VAATEAQARRGHGGRSSAGAAGRSLRRRLAVPLRRLAAAVRQAIAAGFGQRAPRVAPAAANAIGLVGGLLAGSTAAAVELADNRADAMYHLYDGGGVRAQGPALLVRKSVADKVSLSANYYVDMVSNASIDVVTTASPFKETRHEYGIGAETVYRNAQLSLSASHSSEPDYTADAVNLDVVQEVFGGMTTVGVGFTRASDKVGRSNSPEFSETARHWRYRIGVTQILTSRWLASLNVESVSDDGYLGSPYRVARVFGAAVPERVPSTRRSRAVKLRALGTIAERTALAAEYRYFWDTWDIHAHTLGATVSRYFGSAWLADAHVRWYSQSNAVFYSDNFSEETLYVSRNRQLSTFSSIAPGVSLSYRVARAGGYEVNLNGAYEWLRFSFDDFTDLRTGSLYSYSAQVLQLTVSARF
jgi:hypothetical protein